LSEKNLKALQKKHDQADKDIEEKRQELATLKKDMGVTVAALGRHREKSLPDNQLTVGV
jgi:flagellar motility protein MotE (MotC chaperone)